jgi:PAS domain S-box-containing protein
MLEGCQIIGHDWRYVYLNDTAAFHGQRSKEELLGRTMMESYPGIERTDMFAALKRCMDEHTPCRMENEFTYPDGSKGWFELSIQPMLEGIFILSLDITERKRAEVALQEAEVRYRSLVEQIPAIVYTDSATQIGQTLYINPQLKTIVGYGPEEWLADNDLWLKIMHPDDHDRVLAEYTCANETGEPFHAEYRMITRDSRIVWIRDEATLTRDPSGHPLFWQGIMLDITERKRAEEELAQRVEELERFNRLAVGRELRMVELKRQINELSEQLGKEPPYDLSFVEQQ